MWAAQFFWGDKPNSFVTSGGLGTMGFDVPAAMGVQFAYPKDLVWCICGDGSFQMTLQDLATIVEHELPIKFAIINNGYLGMVRQWQTLFYGNRLVSTREFSPDFVKLAEAFGLVGLRVTDKRRGGAGHREGACDHPGPVLIDFQVEGMENCLPDGAAGGQPGGDHRPAQDRSARVLAAAGEREGAAVKTVKHTIVALVENKPGVLNRIASKWRQRGFNIESLAVGHSEMPGLSRMTFVVDGATTDVEQVTKQLYKVIEVVKISDLTDEDMVARELALIKVSASPANRSAVIEVVDIFRADIIDVSPESVIVQVTGAEDKVDAIFEMLRPYGIRELVRTGRVAMTRGAAATHREAPRAPSPSASDPAGEGKRPRGKPAVRERSAFMA